MSHVYAPRATSQDENASAISTNIRPAERLSAARQTKILEVVNRGNIVAVSEIAARLNVSTETIRRDLRALALEGQVRRVHGGVAPKHTLDHSARRPVAERLVLGRDQKLKAADAALVMLEEDMSVFLGSSSTMLLLAERIAHTGIRLHVTTNMIDIALCIGEAGISTVDLLGGAFNPQTRSLVGPDVFRALERRVFDLSISGASAISMAHGILGPTTSQVTFGEILVRQSHRRAYVAHSEKFGRSDGYIVQSFDDVDYIVTDVPPSDEFQNLLTLHDVQVVLPQIFPSRG